MTDTYTARIDHVVEQIQEFSDSVEDPENWMIQIPEPDFNVIASRLETDNRGLGTRYRGASLCYSQDVSQVWVRYSAPLSKHNSTEETND